jgi:hypothetical protein
MADIWCPSCQEWHAHDCGRRLREALRRLHDWALEQMGECMFSADHPIAQAASALYWSRSDALLAEFKETVAKSDAAQLAPVSGVPELADCATRCKCPSLERCARRAAGLDAYGVAPSAPTGFEGFKWRWSSGSGFIVSRDGCDLTGDEIVALAADGVWASALVPLEPTQAMLDAADKVLDADPRFIAAAYRAMLAAAPVSGVRASDKPVTGD